MNDKSRQGNWFSKFDKYHVKDRSSTEIIESKASKLTLLSTASSFNGPVKRSIIMVAEKDQDART